MLFIFCGLPGTGKTTVANFIAKKLNATMISTDHIRKKIFEKPTYQDWEKELVYKVMCLLGEHLSKTQICILDAVFPKEQHRDAVKEMGKRNKIPVYFVEFVCDENTIFKRIANKKRVLSDADYQIYLKLKKEYEPIKFEHIIIDTTAGMDEAVTALEKELESRGILRS